MKVLERLAVVCISLIFAAIAQAQINVVSDTESITAGGWIEGPTEGTPSYSYTAQSGAVGGSLVGTEPGTYAFSQAQQTSSVTNNLVRVSGTTLAESQIFLESFGDNAGASALSNFSLVFTTNLVSAYSFTGSVLHANVNGIQFWDFSLQGASSGIILNDISLENGSESGFLNPDTYTLTFDASDSTGTDILNDTSFESDQFSLGLSSVPDSGIGLLGFAITLVCLCGVLPRFMRRTPV